MIPVEYIGGPSDGYILLSPENYPLPPKLENYGWWYCLEEIFDPATDLTINFRLVYRCIGAIKSR